MRGIAGIGRAEPACTRCRGGMNHPAEELLVAHVCPAGTWIPGGPARKSVDFPSGPKSDPLAPPTLLPPAKLEVLIHQHAPMEGRAGSAKQTAREDSVGQHGCRLPFRCGDSRIKRGVLRLKPGLSHTDSHECRQGDARRRHDGLLTRWRLHNIRRSHLRGGERFEQQLPARDRRDHYRCASRPGVDRDAAGVVRPRRPEESSMQRTASAVQPV